MSREINARKQSKTVQNSPVPDYIIYIRNNKNTVAGDQKMTAQNTKQNEQKLGTLVQKVLVTR